MDKISDVIYYILVWLFRSAAVMFVMAGVYIVLWVVFAGGTIWGYIIGMVIAYFIAKEVFANGRFS